MAQRLKSYMQEKAESWIPYGVFLATGILIPSAGYDDKHISYWSARALSTFGEILNYSGERVEQCSSLLHTLVLAALYSLTPWSMPTLGGLSSIAFGIAAVFVLGKTAEALNFSKTGSQLFLVTSAPFIYWCYGGLETSLTALVVTVLFFSWVKLSSSGSGRNLALYLASLAAFILVRPESIFVLTGLFAGMCLHAILRRREENKYQYLIAGLAFSMFVFGLATLWRLYYFDALFPQPVTAKAGLFTENQTIMESLSIKFKEGVSYTEKILECFPSMIFLVFPFFFFLRRKDSWNDGIQAFALIFLVVYFLFILFSGGDWMEGGRFFAPVLPLCTIALFYGSHDLFGNKLVFCLLACLNLGMTAQFILEKSTAFPLWDTQAQRHHAALGLPGGEDFSIFEYKNYQHHRDMVFVQSVAPIIKHYIASSPERQTLNIFSSQAGFVPYHLFSEYYGKLKFIDQWGLSTRHFTGCDLAKKSRKTTRFGISFDGNFYFRNKELFHEQCNIPVPDLVFFLGSESPWLESHGYTIVYRQQGMLHPFESLGRPLSRRLSGNRTFRYSQFLAVRSDLYEKNPYPKRAITLAVLAES